MQLAISQATTLPHPFADELQACADVGWTGIELWLTKLEKHLETHSLESVRELLTRTKLAPVAASYQGGLLLSQGEQRKTHFEHFRRRLELCQALGVPLLVLAADYAATVDFTALQRAAVSLKQAAQWAAGYDMKLALEFRGGPAVVQSLETAINLVEEVREPNLGICFDLFHYAKGSSKPEDFARLSAANLFHVQVCDVAGVPRELMAESDRIFPGDGDFQPTLLFETLRRIGYQGAVALEVMNPVLWEMKLTQVAELALMALRRTL